MRSNVEVRAPEVTVALATGWLCGLVCSSALPDGVKVAFGIAALAAATFLAAVALASPEGRGGAAAAALLLLGGWLAGAALAPPLAPGVPPSGVARLELEVIETRHAGDGGARSLARVVSGERIQDRRAIEPGLLVRVAPAPLLAGARVRLVGQLSPAATFRNPTPHPPWPLRHAIAARVWVDDPRAVELLDAARPRAWLERARLHVMERLEATLPARTSGVALALVLGEGDAVEESDDQAVRDSGLAHVFAVSGLHVVLLVGALVELLRWLLLRWPRVAERYEARRIACAAGIPIALGYAAFAGGAPSAWRAATTAAIGWALIALGRKPRGAAIAACAVLVLGGLDPREALRPGFLLSVLATAAILAQPAPGPALSGQLLLALRIAAATTLATAPLVVWCFGQLPWVSVLANLLLVPVGSLVLLPIASLHALFASLGLESALTARVLSTGVEAFLNTCAAITAWSPPWTIPPLDVAQAVVLSAGVAALFVVRSARHAAMAISVTACAVLACEAHLRWREQPRGVVRATFLDVGQGDAALIDLPDGRLLLVDAGGNPGGGIDPGKAVLAPLLHARRRERVDIAVLTHPHPDHYGGMSALLDGFAVGELWDSGQAEAESEIEEGAGAASALLARARAAGARVRKPRELCKAPLHAGGARITVLAPCPAHDPGLDPNDNSLVLRIDYRGSSVLLMGDAEAQEEAALLASGAALRADVLKVGHHGSRTSSSPELLAAVQPRVAVISAGIANRFGHPHAEVVERLEQRTPHVLNLAEVGGTTITLDGDARVHVAPFSGPELGL